MDNGIARLADTIIALMTSFFDRLDSFAGIENDSALARLFDRLSFVFLILTALSAPHSIAATQISWGVGILFVFLSWLVRPRPLVRFRPLEIALWVFFGWSVISAVFSYEPAISLDRLRGVSTFLLFVFVISCLKNRRTAYLAAFCLIVSCMVNVLMVPIQRIVGRGVEIHGVSPNGPLGKTGLADGDALLLVNGTKINDPAELVRALELQETVKVTYQRADWYSPVDIRRADLLNGTTAAEMLGISDWNRSHFWRVAGFYSHYTTYAEVLQLLASLAFGLLLAAFRKKRPDASRSREGIAGTAERIFTSRYFLLFAFAAMCIALVLTVTRASQLSLLISVFVIVAVTASRKFLLMAAVAAVPVVLIGLFLLQQSRQVGFFDSKDASTQYRLTMWRDGVRLTFGSPRNAVVGIGMDSIKKRWSEWGLYDNGWLPMGHFHSAPIQIMVERGIPALLIWLIVLGIYARTLWRGIKNNQSGDWRTLGILTGSLGGMVGFFTSGLVHWNLGDGEVAMVFYLLMGLSVKLTDLSVLDNGQTFDEAAVSPEYRAAS